MTIKISESNSKLGKIPSFSIPALMTCPGKSSWCASKCYAAKIAKIYPNVQKSYLTNWEAVNSPDFELQMNNELSKLSKKGKNIFRIHVSGDYHNSNYVDAWTNIIAANSAITFYAYTRSWRVDSMMESLEKLRALPNMTLFASTDKSISEAPPSGWRIAHAGDEMPINFVHCLEQANNNIATCDKCKLCFNGKSTVNIYFSTH